MSKRLAFAVCLAVGMTLALLCLLGSQSHIAGAEAAIRYVAPEGDCGGKTPCYATIQAAVDAANPGDVIKVRQGTYTGVEARPAPIGYHGPAVITQSLYISKTVSIQGGYSAGFAEPPNPETNPTTLDAQGQGRVIFVDRDISPTIEGLRITGGDATGLKGDHWSLDAGGGLFLWHSDPAASISNNWLSGNRAVVGGGVYVYEGAPTFRSNSVASNSSGDLGGGLFLYSSDATITANTISSNTGNGGAGGLFVYYRQPTISANVVVLNSTNGRGGGMYLQGGAAVLTNNVIADNQAKGGGSGLCLLDSSPQLLHTTIARNHGGDGSGMYAFSLQKPSSVTLTNTILVGHKVGIAAGQGYTATLSATLWHANDTDFAGNVVHANDLSGDPAFAADGYHLSSSSPAVDSGVDSGVTRDLDYDVRPQGPGFDIGADELRQWWYIHFPVVLTNS